MNGCYIVEYAGGYIFDNTDDLKDEDKLQDGVWDHPWVELNHVTVYDKNGFWRYKPIGIKIFKHSWDEVLEAQSQDFRFSPKNWTML